MLGAVVFAGSPIAAQPPSVPASSVVQQGIDVLDYDVTVELPDTGAFIRGDVVVTLRRGNGASTLLLDLVDALAVRSITVNGASVQVEHAHDRLTIPLAGVQDSLAVRVTYDGVVTDGLVVRKDKQGRWTWFGDNWPDRARQWLPVVDRPGDKATVRWTVLAPAGRTVVANGLMVGTRRVTVRGASRQATEWREARPIPPYLMVIGAGPLEHVELREPDCHFGDQGQCVRQSMYVKPELRRWLPGPFLAAGPIMSLFEKLIGPFPYEKLAHVQSATRFGGMENASAIFYADNLFTSHTLEDGIISHETAHQWFGDAVTEGEFAHLWLSEGFATYFAAIWTQYVRGDRAFAAEMGDMRKQLLTDSIVARRPVIDTAQTDYLKLLNANSYVKGGYVLYMLHDLVGDSAFFAGVRSYYTKYRHSTAVSDDLRVEMEKASNRDLRQFFEQWLRRPGVATPMIGWAWDPATRKVTVVAVQDSLTGGYELPLVIEVKSGAASASTRVTVVLPAGARGSVVVPGEFAEKPRALTFDPDEHLLARITRM